jgi:hypothetical protein
MDRFTAARHNDFTGFGGGECKFCVSASRRLGIASCWRYMTIVDRDVDLSASDIIEEAEDDGVWVFRRPIRSIFALRV